jgi:hypothetical protein
LVLPLRPKRGGFLRPFGCGTFIKEYLSSNGASVQADIFREYKNTLLAERALDMATKAEEKLARYQKRSISPDNIDKLTTKYQDRLPFKSNSCRYHSFVTYFSMLIRLGWVEFTGQIESSEFSRGQERRYYRLTVAGMAASDFEWSNPHRALYG